jgi:hypothetical protein
VENWISDLASRFNVSDLAFRVSPTLRTDSGTSALEKQSRRQRPSLDVPIIGRLSTLEE